VSGTTVRRSQAVTSASCRKNEWRKLILLTLFFGALTVQAAPEYGTVIVTKVISVYDGDTFRVDIDSLPPIVGKNIPIRLNGVDTPEIRGKCKYEKDLAIKARNNSNKHPNSGIVKVGYEDT
jgi:endonuclease YncB( thermonuclease family)